MIDFKQYQNELNLAFDPTYGFQLDELLQIQVDDYEPADFDDFWLKVRKDTPLHQIPLERRELCQETVNHFVDEIYFRTTESTLVGAYLLRPKKERPRKLLLRGHGYGGLKQVPSGFAPDVVVLCLMAPGFNLSADPSLPSVSMEHVIHGIDAPNTYLLKRCVAAWWTAVGVMEDLYPELMPSLTFLGGSFSGGIGALAIPWEPRINSAILESVTFANHPFRLNCDLHGSGRAVKTYHSRSPEILQKTLSYYEACFSCRRIRIPVLFRLALFDPSVPPPGQFSAYNCVRADLKRLITKRVGHAKIKHEALEQEEAEYRACLQEHGLIA